MGRKKKKKSKKKKFDTMSFIVTLVFIGCIVVFGYYNGESRKKKLKEKGYNTVAVVEKLKINARKGKTGRKDLVYFFFVKKDTVFHKISDLHSGTIKRLNIKKNDAFVVRVVKDDYAIFKVDYKSRLDTIIDKRRFKHQKYNTFIHRNIIE